MGTRIGEIRKERKSPSKLLKNKQEKTFRRGGHLIHNLPYGSTYHTRNIHEWRLESIMSDMTNSRIIHNGLRRRQIQTPRFRNYRQKTKCAIHPSCYKIKKLKCKPVDTFMIVNTFRYRIKSKKTINYILKHFENLEEKDFVFEKKRFEYSCKGESQEKPRKQKYILDGVEDCIFSSYFNE